MDARLVLAAAAIASDVVVSQHWQIAPFGSAHIRVTSADVAGRVVDEHCMTSVVAVTGPDQGPTREG